MKARAPLIGLVALGMATPLTAQWRGDDSDYERYNVRYDGRFTFVRIQYKASPEFGSRRGFWGGEDLKWDHDYPRAERHLVKILSEITTIVPYMEGSNILAADDPELFRYPVAYLAEPGFWTLTEQEKESLRAYLLKGGFIIVDDFVDRQWYNFADRVKDLLPEARPIRLDPSHEIFHSFFDIDVLDHRHPYWGQRAEFYGIFEDNDPRKRMMMIVNFNNDIGESWEWSDTGFIPIELSNEAYKLGVNYIVYAMTH